MTAEEVVARVAAIETLESVVASLRARLDAVRAVVDDGDSILTREALNTALNGYGTSGVVSVVCTNCGADDLACSACGALGTLATHALALGAGEGSEAAGLRARIKALSHEAKESWAGGHTRPDWMWVYKTLDRALAARAGGDEGSGGEAG